MLQWRAWNHFAHHQRKHRRRKRDTRPKAASHVLELGVRFVRRGLARLEGHTANRAGARLAANDLRVHRTGVFSLLAPRGRALNGSKILLRIRLELFHAGWIAKIVSLPLVVHLPGRFGGIDGHPANWVFHSVMSMYLLQIHNYSAGFNRSRTYTFTPRGWSP